MGHHCIVSRGPFRTPIHFNFFPHLPATLAFSGLWGAFRGLLGAFRGYIEVISGIGVIRGYMGVYR